MPMTLPLVQPATGPEEPPSSRPRSGVLGGKVYSFAFDPALGIQRVNLPGGQVTASEHGIVDWAFYADGPAATSAPWPALAVSIDVRFEDGSRLSDDPRVRDRHDFPFTADAQYDAHWSLPEQWNASSVSLAPRAQQRGTVELVFGATGLEGWAGGTVGGFVEVRVREHVPGRSPSLAERIDTRRGTHSGPDFPRGGTLPIIARPHSFTFLTPVTDASSATYPYRPYAHDDRPGQRRLEAISFSHQAYPSLGDHGVLQVMPYSGRPVSGREARRRYLETNSCIARPHLWAATLDDGTYIEATATSHVGAFRVRGSAVGFVLDQFTDDGMLRFDQQGRFTGWIPEGDPSRGNAPRTYFAGHLVDGASGHGILEDAGHGRVAGYVAGAGPCELRIAVSFISIEQARRNLRLEASDEVSFEDLVAQSRSVWDELLGRVVLPPLPPEELPFRVLADRERRATLCHALYRLHLYPNTMAENTDENDDQRWRYVDPLAVAAPHDDRGTGAPVRDGELMVNNRYSDTYRTVWPALMMLDAPLAARLVDGTLGQSRVSGWTVRSSAPGHVAGNLSTAVDQITAEAERWGLVLDVDEALEAAWRNSCEPEPDEARGRAGNGAARFTGYVASSTPQALAWTIENSISDAAIGMLCSRLERLGEAPSWYRAMGRYFRNRSLSYRGLFDPATGFFRSRSADGSFGDEVLDPFAFDGLSTPWSSSAPTPHDGVGIAALYGGPGGLRAHLDSLFADAPGAYPDGKDVPTSLRRARALRAGQGAASRMPHHLPYMYAFTDQPWRAGAMARSLARRLFTGGMIAQGFPGEDTNGELSAWWLWALVGLYPLVPASGQLLIGNPIADDVTVRRGGGGGVRVVSRRSRPGAEVLTSALLDGRPLSNSWLFTSQLRRDHVLELMFAHADDGPVPLGAGPHEDVREYRPDLTGGEGHLIASEGLDAAPLVDDRGETVVELQAGDWVGWAFDYPRRVTDLTLTTGEDSDSEFLSCEVSIDGETFREVPSAEEGPLPANRTSPFELAIKLQASAVRLRALEPIRLRQFELFSLD